ncbi:MAG: hypothetical protein K9I85_12455 [Saprospiraceae bacterium]|nr:hypothetical protein [Saprospiraceae bacterium]
MTLSRYSRDLWARWTHWEFWPSWLFNLPVLLIWLYYGLRSGNLFFFTRANPVIETGGLLGESKINIYQHLPAGVYPNTVFIPAEVRQAEEIRDLVNQQNIQWPAIAKPNMGERGFLVLKCADESTMIQHLLDHPGVDFLVQDFVAWKEEYSIMYHRFPNTQTGQITSLCLKGFLTVTGDGKRTVADLMTDHPRASFQQDRMTREQPALLASIPEEGEELLLEPIGNHCRGTTFLNANHRITPALTATFDRISLGASGLFYGRFDLRTRTLADLEKGRHYSILEYNGVASEPAHIYHPGRPLWKAYRDIFAHWGILYRVCQEQKRQGVPAETAGQVLQQLRDWWQYKQSRS